MSVPSMSEIVLTTLLDERDSKTLARHFPITITITFKINDNIYKYTITLANKLHCMEIHESTHTCLSRQYSKYRECEQEHERRSWDGRESVSTDTGHVTPPFLTDD